MEHVNEPALLAIVVATALAFDFTNGFHDTGNAMATSIATRALKPGQAVLLSASLNMVGAFLSLTVAATIATGAGRQTPLGSLETCPGSKALPPPGGRRDYVAV